MLLETSEPEELKLNMTAMIDIVFQLLVFFVMTFKVVAMEGDFNIKMPLAAADGQSVDDLLPDLIQITLEPDAAGNLASMTVDNGSGAQSIEGPFFWHRAKRWGVRNRPQRPSFRRTDRVRRRSISGRGESG